MLTPRLSLSRRVTAALDASPSRIPVLLGGCGSGRSSVLQQLRERLGRGAVQYIDIDRTAALTSPVSGAGAWKLAPPWTIRWPTAATSAGTSASIARAASPPRPGSHPAWPSHTTSAGAASAAPGPTS